MRAGRSTHVARNFEGADHFVSGLANHAIDQSRPRTYAQRKLDKADAHIARNFECADHFDFGPGNHNIIEIARDSTVPVTIKMDEAHTS